MEPNGSTEIAHALQGLLQACRNFYLEFGWGGDEMGAYVKPYAEKQFDAAKQAARDVLEKSDGSTPERTALADLLEACRKFTGNFRDYDARHATFTEEEEKEWRDSCDRAARQMPDDRWKAPWA